jgi:hypothetical protein
MDLLELAEEHFLFSLTIVLGIGLLQGGVLARGLRHRFPSLKRHARLASVILLLLFSINAIANVFKFAIPEKLTISDLTIPSAPEEGYAFVINVLGLNAGFAMVVAMFISVTIILFLRFADLSRPFRYFIFSISVMFAMVVAMFISVTIILFLRFADLSRPFRYFIFSISVIMVLIAGISRFTDYIPTLFQILMYALYQFGLTIGIFLVARRKETDFYAELE